MEEKIKPAVSQRQSSRFLFLLRTGAVNGFLVVALGAFGAHTLRDLLSDTAVKTYQTAVLYHAIHSLAVLGCAVLLQHARPARVHLAAWFFLIGIVLFCGSLYLLSATGIRWLGAVTPFGGVAFLSGWALLVFSVPYPSSSPHVS
ncbi:MAG: DUF423 domain-containing protein [Bacteroidia bacterium]|nr:DUF423 domain-containing protein [Bacteroidia bacterium]